jgi:hypothetical protein
LIAGLLTANGSTWLVKMPGTADAEATAKPGLDHPLQSLRLE